MFKDSFKLFEFTVHTLADGETPGKGSNENYCLRKMDTIFESKGIAPEDVLFTTLDCDSWIPEAYFEEVELYLSEHGWEMDRFMFGMNQMFTQNNTSVPLLCRVADQCLASMVYIWSSDPT